MKLIFFNALILISLIITHSGVTKSCVVNEIHNTSNVENNKTKLISDDKGTEKISMTNNYRSNVNNVKNIDNDNLGPQKFNDTTRSNVKVINYTIVNKNHKRKTQNTTKISDKSSRNLYKSIQIPSYQYNQLENDKTDFQDEKEISNSTHTQKIKLMSSFSANTCIPGKERADDGNCTSIEYSVDSNEIPEIEIKEEFT